MNIHSVIDSVDTRNILNIGDLVLLSNGTEATIISIEMDGAFREDDTFVPFARVEVRTLDGNLLTVIE